MGTVLFLVSVHYLRVLESRSSSVRIVHMYSRVDARDSLFLHHTQALYIHHSIVPDISKGRHMHLNLALLCNECAIWSSENLVTCTFCSCMPASDHARCPEIFGIRYCTDILSVSSWIFSSSMPRTHHKFMCALWQITKVQAFNARPDTKGPEACPKNSQKARVELARLRALKICAYTKKGHTCHKGSWLGYSGYGG
jgi:hypothetical protein